MIALDNFGAGPSSLSLPASLPLDILKLDRGLIQDFERDKRHAGDGRAVARTRPARPDLTAVAVGIETAVSLRSRASSTAPSARAICCAGPTRPSGCRLGDAGRAITSAPWHPIVRMTRRDAR